MVRSFLFPLALSLLPAVIDAQSSEPVTVYFPKNTQVIFGPVVSTTATAGAAAYTGAAAYNPTTLNAPAPPNPAITTQFPLQLLSGGMANMSIPIPANFM